ncbi:MAG TPA: hypothetical protein VM511_03960, partial [Luteolibacter sp.]|nr:hypothetical protein [Luteolibacter sp.]
VVKTTSVIRNDIGPQTFGAGVEFPSVQFRWLMDTGPHADGPSTPARNAIKDLNLGLMRFPSGDSAQLYFWDDPQHSIPNSNPKDPRAKWLTQDEMLKFTSGTEHFADGLGMDRLFQVNTCQFIDYDQQWKIRQLNRNFFKKQLPAEIDPEILNRLSTRAAKWVEENGKRPGHEKVTWWEIGNEDWIYWTGSQYAEIFNAFHQKMSAARPDIKLLAQGLSNDFKTGSNGTNTMENWIEGMKKSLADPKSVYAYSDHQYLSGGEFPDDPQDVRRGKQTRNMLSKTAFGKRTADLKAKLEGSPETAPWKIWVTEFNTYERVGGKLDNPQDMAQALVIADWTGKMLEQNVERIVYHSLDHHPDFALVQYVNEGGSIKEPRVTPPGHAFSIFSSDFGRKMVACEIDRNPELTAPDGAKYPQVGAYAAIRQESGRDELRVVVINRNTDQETDFELKAEAVPGARRFPNKGMFFWRELSSKNLSDTNRERRNAVAWSNAEVGKIDSEMIRKKLKPASVNLFVIPLN